MKIYLIRHGESTGDVENRYGGSYDDLLTPRGRAQAGQLSGQLAGHKIELLYTSPYHRAYDTAQILAAGIGCEVAIVTDLRERDYGVLSGMERKAAAKKYPEAVDQHKNFHNTDPGGEGYEDFKNRVVNVFQKIADDTHYETVAILTHGGPIKCLARETLGLGEIPDIGDCGFRVIETKK